MSLEYQYIIGILAVLSFLVTAFFFFLSLKKKHQQDIEKLQKEIQLLREKQSKSKEQISKLESKKHDTSYITDQIQKVELLEEELLIQRDRVQDAKIIAQEANKVKHEFLTNVSHEIRTPMNSILVFAKLLSQELHDKKYLGYSNNIVQSGHKLLRILDDVIELSRIETGGFEVDNGAVDINGLFEDVVQEQKSLAIRKGLKFTLEIDETLPVTLIIDAKKVKEILHNLVGNALKFTNSGFVKIKVKVQRLNVEKNSVDIAVFVEDSGVGIDKAKQEQIFKIFENREHDTEIEAQGTGLGLSINKRMATLLNGTLSVESQVDKGSRFAFILYDVEIVLMSSSDEEEELSVDFSLVSPDGAKVLVVDELESQDIIQDSFRDTAVKVFSYDNPRDAIEMLKVQKVDLIFMDVDIFSVDENAVSKVLAGMSQAPVVTLTDNGVRDIAFDDGGARVVGHLKKPISRVELFKLSIKELNASHIATRKEYELEAQGEEFSKLNKQKIEKFLLEHKKYVQGLFEIAISTNDLNAIKKFAEELLILSKSEEIVLFTLYSEELLEHIEHFEIDDISAMLQEYKSKIKSLESL
ncbi:MAG: ATP-binding protein [Campylobacterota bacterium]|nr:ATP-binding protein [Campylobacterota bacterium]